MPGQPYGQPYPQPGYPVVGYNPADPEAPYGRNQFGEPYSDKQKLLAGLLEILLPFGIGRFYLGHTGIAIAQLLLTFLCGIGAVWCVIDGILILAGNVRDPYGRPLRD
ncbi:TM2 domain-containing protein [Nocardia panacis]|uniref:TM2 domain-containing protein n=2 Tax=Nocardia panacis TaxID=2340916 RepID=A0A3A4KA55_9NOCA|nr:TM2 domain-containing protein [Nocardia panacis]